MPISYRAAQTLIKRGDEDTLSNALAEGLNANSRNANGWTLLMLAAVEGSVPLGTLLLHYGALAAEANARGETARTIAEARGHTEFAALLPPAPTAPATTGSAATGSAATGSAATGS